MICLTVTITKTYVDHGLYNVPQNTRFALEMLNLVVMFATFVLNISICITEQRQWEFQELHDVIFGIYIAQALVLLLIMTMAINYWTRGGLSYLLYAMHLSIHIGLHSQGLVLPSGRRRPYCPRTLSPSQLFETTQNPPSATGNSSYTRSSPLCKLS